MPAAPKAAARARAAPACKMRWTEPGVTKRLPLNATPRQSAAR
jgi:hypothetical protein